jgi:hypothetical protein
MFQAERILISKGGYMDKEGLRAVSMTNIGKEGSGGNLHLTR